MAVAVEVAHANLRRARGHLANAVVDVVRNVEVTRRVERDSGARPGPTTAEQQRIKELEREVRELRKTNEILKLASAYFAQAEFDRQLKR